MPERLAGIMQSLPRYVAQGRAIPAKLMAAPTDSTPLIAKPAGLRERLETEGYLYLPSALEARAVAAARLDLLEAMAAVGEIEHPAELGVATGQSRRRELHPDLGAFWRTRSESPKLRALTHGTTLAGLAGRAFGEAACGFEFIFLRVGVPGRATHIHCDAPFFTRCTGRVITAWVALSDIPPERGPLFLVAGSHQWADVRESVRGYDVARDRDRRAAWPDHPADLAERRGTQLISTAFAAGDVILFGMHLLHGAFDNHDPKRRARVSCDVRYQPVSEPFDPRYFGADPGGTTGAGYAELNGAKPLTEDWHIR